MNEVYAYGFTKINAMYTKKGEKYLFEVEYIRYSGTIEDLGETTTYTYENENGDCYFLNYQKNRIPLEDNDSNCGVASFFGDFLQVRYLDSENTTVIMEGDETQIEVSTQNQYNCGKYIKATYTITLKDGLFNEYYFLSEADFLF